VLWLAGVWSMVTTTPASGARAAARLSRAARRRSVATMPECNAKLWPKALPRPRRFHDLRHTAATLMLRAGVDAHRVQRILRHASVTTTTGTYGHLTLEDLRDAVGRIGPAPFADSLLTVREVAATCASRHGPSTLSARKASWHTSVSPTRFASSR
jgi:hypothetical protein